MKTEHVTNKGTQTTRIPNKLIDEKSPYLQQHAYNPVNWFPWGDEAFDKAKKENKPILLSIGYSTCHWCHVMAHECFEDQEIAEILNASFISIKVDKEERPDIDTVYMTVCQITTGQGGWPLTVLMTPDQKPFFVATYLPKNSRPGVLGLIDLMVQVKADWQENSGTMISTGDKLADIMKREFEASSDSSDVTKELIGLAVTQFNQKFDHDYGGFGNEPKFPTPHNLMFLLRHAQLEADETSLFMVENTLKHIYRGGIYDHVGYGFSRYSTDAQWLVPHFEKMLYDNALLATIYAETYQYTKNPLYRTVAEQIFEYIRREMTDPEGGFYCAQDADSEGIEGRYYTFTPEEIDKILDKDDASFFCEYFDITKEGNFEEGRSIPNLLKATELKSENEKVMRVCNKVYSYRLDRARLHKDDKALTSWNALMIHAYATAARIFQNEDYVDVAKHAATFVNTRLTDPNGLLYVSYRDGKPAHFGLIDDYAFYAMALLSLYDVTFDIDYIHQACRLADRMIELFWDRKYGGFFLNANDAEKLIYRPKEVYDGAIPSGNSVAGYVLKRLANLTANTHYMEYADRQLRFLAGQVKDYPAGHSFALIAFLQALYPSKEIVCVVSENEDYKELSDYLAEHFEPNTTVLLKSEKNFEKVLEIADYAEDYRIINNKTTYYVCENHHCMAPSNELACTK